MPSEACSALSRLCASGNVGSTRAPRFASALTADEYRALGIDEFILSGYPDRDRRSPFSTGAMRVLRERGLLTRASASAPQAACVTN